MKSQFITPVVSVFDAKGRPDPEQNQRLYAHLIAGGVSGMAVLGSTGEFFAMDMPTSKAFIDMAAPNASASFRVFAGASRMDPDESIELANHALDKGASGVMIISPYYVRLTPEAIFDYYARIARAVPGKIYLYNFPDRTGYSLAPATVLKLATTFKNIAGLKDTLFDMNHTCDLIKTVKSELPEFEIFSGFDNNFAHNILSGGNGCIGALSNLAPEIFAAWIAAVDAQDFAGIAKSQRIVDRLMDLYGIGDPFIPVVKKALVMRGIIDCDVCTKPLRSADAAATEKLRALFDAVGLAPVPAR